MAPPARERVAAIAEDAGADIKYFSLADTMGWELKISPSRGIHGAALSTTHMSRYEKGRSGPAARTRGGRR